MKELSFKEVIATIKVGEVWESAFKSISLSDEGDIIIKNANAYPGSDILVFQPITKYRLKEETIKEGLYKSLWKSKSLKDYRGVK